MRRSARKSGLWSLAVAVVLAVASVAGCGGNREAALVGNWKIDASAIKMPEGAATNPQQKMGMEMAKQMMANASIDIKQDKSFTMTMGAPMEGTWAFDDAASTVSLTMTKVMGMDISKMPNASKTNNQPLVCALSADGKQLTVRPQSGQASPGGNAMVFVKQ